MCLDGRHVMSEHQPFGAAQLSIKIAYYDSNKSFHCNELSSVVANLEVFCHCRGFLEAQQLMIRITDEIVMHVLGRVRFVEAHKPSAIWSGVGCFLMALLMIFPMRREGRDCSPINVFISNCWRVSGADSSAISLEMFV